MRYATLLSACSKYFDILYYRCWEKTAEKLASVTLADARREKEIIAPLPRK